MMGREVIEVFTDRDEAQRALIDLLRGPQNVNQPRCERGSLFLRGHRKVVVWALTMWVAPSEVELNGGCAA